METTYYTFTAREILVTGDGVEQAVGGARRLVFARRATRPVQPAHKDNVIDLDAWRMAREEEAAMEVSGRPSPPASDVQLKPRRDRRSRILFGGELLASLSVVGAMVLLMIRVLGG